MNKPKRSKDTKATYSVLEKTYHRLLGEPPISTDSRYTIELSSDEEPCTRTYKVKPVEELLKFGWVEEPGMVCIANKGDVKVTLWKGDPLIPILIIPPGQSFRGIFPDTDIYVCSELEECKIKITVYPNA